MANAGCVNEGIGPGGGDIAPGEAGVDAGEDERGDGRLTAAAAAGRGLDGKPHPPDSKVRRRGMGICVGIDAGADAAVSMLLLVSFSASIAASKRGVSCFVRIGSGTADGIRVSFDTDTDTYTEIRRGHLVRVVVKVLTFS